MCFSPAASFTAAAVLSVAGIAALRISTTGPQRVLSGIPLLFALQQVTEGVLWMSLADPSLGHLAPWAMYGFLLFAQVIWPVYVPFSMFVFEQVAARKKLIGMLMAAGLLFGAYSAWCLYAWPVSAEIEAHHIRYNLGYALSQKWYYGLLYFIPTILAPLAASDKKLHWLGYLFLGSYIVARVLFHFYVISVWCFFGAIISIAVLLIIVRQNKQQALRPSE
jgi:hypothetical protein